jgi:hypothetical protein
MSDVEPITRPNGKPYRPRKVIAHGLSDEPGDCITGVLVTGTHGQVRALFLARVLVHREVGPDYEPLAPEAGWWRDGMDMGERSWIADDEHGQAGVLFRKIEEVAFRG